jgi:hypothetical protein
VSAKIIRHEAIFGVLRHIFRAAARAKIQYGSLI